MNDCSISIAGQALRLLPERAVFWPAAGALLVADLHADKPETLRAAHIAAPASALETDLQRLSSALHRTRAHRLVILGDLYHAPRGADAPVTARALHRWRRAHAALEIDLVVGNHDRRAGPPPETLAIRSHADALDLQPFRLVHEPAPDPAGYVLAGHVHAGVRLAAGADAVTVPAFRFGPAVGVLPSFGALTAPAPTPPHPSERIYAIADDEVIPL
ncbi:MAG: ligase-associated DNA damage response endonuclease PdeM [Rubricoccaceae bacterium]|nr:ligase-associated DNA damage response endonuclease PdeM [Rubricoccaceae bacterium]